MVENADIDYFQFLLGSNLEPSTYLGVPLDIILKATELRDLFCLFI
jgi:hypothetical protein